MSAHLFNSGLNKDSSNTNKTGVNDPELFPRENGNGFSLDKTSAPKNLSAVVDTQTPYY